MTWQVWSPTRILCRRFSLATLQGIVQKRKFCFCASFSFYEPSIWFLKSLQHMLTNQCKYTGFCYLFSFGLFVCLLVFVFRLFFVLWAKPKPIVIIWLTCHFFARHLLRVFPRFVLPLTDGECFFRAWHQLHVFPRFASSSGLAAILHFVTLTVNGWMGFLKILVLVSKQPFAICLPLCRNPLISYHQADY